MRTAQKRRGPDTRQRVEAGKQSYSSQNSSRSNVRLPANWRDRLPDPGAYYRQHIAKLSKANALGWAQGACPFHDDRHASLSVNVTGARGAWRCFASCGGGDLIGFAMRLTGMSFSEAVADLLRWRA